MKKICALFVFSSLMALPLCAHDWTKESRDRNKRDSLHDVSQSVRGDSGKWNEVAHILHMPRKPAKLSLDAWADQIRKKQINLTDKDDHWLLLRAEQLNDNDRVWVERIERRGNKFTVVVNQAKWKGKYFRNFTYYPVIGLNLGKLEPGKYEANWIIKPMVFVKFDGDGKAQGNWPKDENPAKGKATELRITFVVSPSSR